MKNLISKTIVTMLIILLANVVVWGQNSCPPPTNLNAVTTSNSATITWTGSLTTYYVEYHALTSDNWDVDEVTTNSITLSGLSPSASYEALIYGECADGFSDTASITFKCACGTVNSLPYFDGFEINTPNCWSSVGDGFVDGSNWELINGTTYNPAYEGNKQYYSAAITYGSNPNTYLISPAIQVPANADGVNLSWYGRATEGENKYRVMVSTATNSVDDFGNMLLGVTNEGSSWTEHSVSLDNYAGQTIYIAFWHYNSNYGGGVYIDNINISQILNPTVEITGPDVVDINQTATLNANLIMGSNEDIFYLWSNTRTDAVYGAVDSAQFHISYPSFGYDTITLVVGNNHGLDTTTFEIYARDLTPISTFPYSTGFEVGDDVNWTNAGEMLGWYIGEATAATDSRSLYISHDGGLTNSYVVYDDESSFTFAYRPFYFTSGDYVLGFDWKAHGGFGDDGIVMLTDDISVFQADVRPNPNDYTTLCEELNDEWHSWTHRDQVFHIDDPGVYYIAFYWLVDGFHGFDNAFAVDNVTIDRIGCSSVSNLTVDNITTNSISYSWTPNSGEQLWLISLNNGTPITVTDTFYTATGLTTATTYNFSVSALCDNGDTSDMVMVTAVTGCTVINNLPHIEDFENYPLGATELPCWNHLGSGDISIDGGGVSGQALWFTPDGNADPFLVVMPEFSMNISGLKLTMQSKPQDNFSGRFQIGYITDPDDESTFQTILQLSVGDFEDANENIVFTEHTAYFTNAPAGARIALRQDPWGSGRFWIVDNIVVTDTNDVDPIDTCKVPTSLNLLSVDTTSAVVDWTVVGDEQQWELDINGVVYIVNAHPYTFTDLTPDTDYSVRIRAMCDTDNYSEWSPMLTFTTDTIPSGGDDGDDDGDGDGDDDGDDTSIEDLANIFFEIFPNPASDNITVSIEEEVAMTIFDQNGRTVMQQRLGMGNNIIDVSNYSAGVYYIRITTEKGSAIRKLIVK